MRIALFSETYLPQRNGVALILDRLVRHLCSRGHEVLIAVPVSWRPKGEAPLPERAQIVRVPGLPVPKYPDLTIGTPYSRRVMRAVREFKPDIVHVATEFTMGLTGLRAARKLGVPAVASFHTNLPGTLPYYGFGWASGFCWDYLRWFHNHAEVTFCPSETNRQVLLDRGFEHVQIWSRGVDTERFAPEHRSDEVREKSGPDDALHLLYVGRLTPEKDLKLLFEAYQRLTAMSLSNPVHLVVAGDGAYSTRMMAAAPEKVTFAGYLEGQDLSRAYSSADVFVFPSKVETLGNVVLEAMASGLPVVGVAQGGTLENVRHGVNGVLCEPGDTDSFTAGILEVSQSPQLREQLARNARTWAEQRNWEAAFEPLLSSYEELAGR